MHTSAPKKILIAEDSYVTGQVMQRSLEREGFAVIIANNGTEALDALDLHQFDLVISDFQMPDMNGDELCRHIRMSERHADVPIAFCTAKGYEVDIDALSSELSISHVFLKPFSLRAVNAFARAAIKESCAIAS